MHFPQIAGHQMMMSGHIAVAGGIGAIDLDKEIGQHMLIGIKGLQSGANPGNLVVGAHSGRRSTGPA